MESGMIIEGLAESRGTLRETALEMAVRLCASGVVEVGSDVLGFARKFEAYLTEPEGDSMSTAAVGMARQRQQVYDLIQQDIVELENLVPESVEDGQYRDGEIAGLKKAAGHLVATGDR